MKRFIGIISSLLYLFANPTYAFAQQVNVKPNIAPPIEIGNLITAVINLLFVVAAVVAVVFLVYGGIRWIISGGDKAAVESARNTIIAAIIGLVIVILSFFIITLVFQFLGLPNFLNNTFNLPSVNNPNIQ